MRRQRGVATSLALHPVFTVIAVLIPLLFFIPFLYVEATNSINSVAKRYTIEGSIDGEVGSKLKLSSEGNGTTKYSVPLRIGSGRVIINCTSTQCDALKENDLAVFSCYEEWHLFTPNEEECRFKQLR